MGPRASQDLRSPSPIMAPVADSSLESDTLFCLCISGVVLFVSMQFVSQY